MMVGSNPRPKTAPKTSASGRSRSYTTGHIINVRDSDSSNAHQFCEQIDLTPWSRFQVYRLNHSATLSCTSPIRGDTDASRTRDLQFSFSPSGIG